MLWFLSGNERMRWLVALKNALSTAGAATATVGSLFVAIWHFQATRHSATR